MYGKLATYDGYERFEWSHSYSKVFYPKGKYEPWGVFMYFENYNVEVRERVKCLSATEGTFQSVNSTILLCCSRWKVPLTILQF